MEGNLNRFLAGEFLNNPLVMQLFMLAIFALGAMQIVKIIHTWWNKGKLKTQEKQVNEDKGKWKAIMEQVLEELKIRNERADKIYDKVQWLYEVHHKFDDDGVPIWYVRKSLEKVIVQLADSIKKQTEIMGQIFEELRDQKHSLERVEDKISNRR